MLHQNYIHLESLYAPNLIETHVALNLSVKTNNKITL